MNSKSQSVLVLMSTSMVGCLEEHTVLNFSAGCAREENKMALSNVAHPKNPCYEW